MRLGPAFLCAHINAPNLPLPVKAGCLVIARFSSKATRCCDTWLSAGWGGARRPSWQVGWRAVCKRMRRRLAVARMLSALAACSAAGRCGYKRG